MLHVDIIAEGVDFRFVSESTNAVANILHQLEECGALRQGGRITLTAAKKGWFSKTVVAEYNHEIVQNFLCYSGGR